MSSPYSRDNTPSVKIEFQLRRNLMHLSQMLHKMVLPCKPIRGCSIASPESAAVVFHTSVGSLMSLKLGYSAVGFVASVDTACELVRTGNNQIQDHYLGRE